MIGRRAGAVLGVAASIALLTGAPVAAKGGVLGPCSLLTRAEIATVMNGNPQPPATDVAIPDPPNGKGCSWVSTKTRDALQGVLQVVVQLWDFRDTSSAFAQRYGTKAKRYVRALCASRPPISSAGQFSEVTNLPELGDAACTVASHVDVARGPYFAIVTAGSLGQNEQHAGAAVVLTKDVLRRLR